MCFKTMSNFADKNQYFAIFQQPGWEFDQDADFKKIQNNKTPGNDGLRKKIY